MLKNEKKKNKGITLIALVITIIVLLILAGVSIATLTGQNGILTQAQNAAEKTEVASAKEQAQMDILAWQSDRLEKGESTNLNNSIIKEILTGKDYVGTVGDESFTTKNGEYEIPYTDLYSPDKVELPEGLQVGSTVYYNPDGTYEWKSKYCSSPEDTSYQKTLDSTSGEFDLQRWKVFDYNEETGEVMLVPEHSTDDGESVRGTVYLKGAQGYNNAVQLLNEACNNLYGNEEKGITARSIKIEDIEGKMDETKLAAFQKDAGYLEQVSNAYTKANSWYPSIYAKENLACINGSKNNSGIGISEQYENRLIEPDESLINTTKITEGKIQGENIQPTHTYYNASYFDLETAFIEKDGVNYKDLLLPDEDNTFYWVASRCVYAYSDRSNFNVSLVGGGGLSYYYVFRSGDFVSNDYLGLFPIVSLPEDLLEEGTDTDFIVK